MKKTVVALLTLLGLAVAVTSLVRVLFSPTHI